MLTYSVASAASPLSKPEPSDPQSEPQRTEMSDIKTMTSDGEITKWPKPDEVREKAHVLMVDLLTSWTPIDLILAYRQSCINEGIEQMRKYLLTRKQEMVEGGIGYNVILSWEVEDYGKQ